MQISKKKYLLLDYIEIKIITFFIRSLCVFTFTTLFSSKKH